MDTPHPPTKLSTIIALPFGLRIVVATYNKFPISLPLRPGIKRGCSGLKLHGVGRLPEGKKTRELSRGQTPQSIWNAPMTPITSETMPQKH
jgi:hypothetical protein